MRLSFLLLPAAMVLAGGCATRPTAEHAPSKAFASQGTESRAEAALAPASGSLASGLLLLEAQDGGLHVTGILGGLKNTPVAFHIHEKGDCSAVDATSAGPHFNPLGHDHGGPHTTQRHLGDLPNLTPDAEGRVKVDVRVDAVVLGGGAINDALGRALVVHASADDHSSQPAGNAGARIACGVIRPAR